jgi:esterase/lipase superfamily enzyme
LVSTTDEIRGLNSASVALAAALLLTAAAAAGCGGIELIPPPNLYRVAGEDPFADMPEAHAGDTVEIVYGTDRKRCDGQPAACVFYGGDRCGVLEFGVAAVKVGGGLPWDTLRRESVSPSRSVRLPVELAEVRPAGAFPESPLPLVRRGGRMAEDPASLEEDRAAADRLRDLLRRQLAGCRRKEVFLFVHGVNSSWEWSACTLAEIWHFLGRDGVPVLYTWPAGKNGILGYFGDRESGEFTVFHLKRFLRTLATTPELKKIHVIAHSRGTDVFTTALRELNLEEKGAGRDFAAARASLKMGTVILAAPDLDTEVVSQRIAAERVHLVPERVVVYTNTGDRLLNLSNWLFDGVIRLGQLVLTDGNAKFRERLAALLDLEIVQADVRADFFGHSYFYGSPAALSDIVLVLRYGRRPGPENGRPLEKLADGYWRFDDSYPVFEGAKAAAGR